MVIGKVFGDCCIDLPAAGLFCFNDVACKIVLVGAYLFYWPSVYNSLDYAVVFIVKYIGGYNIKSLLPSILAFVWVTCPITLSSRAMGMLLATGSLI